METLPPNLQRLLLIGFDIRKSPHDPGLAGIELRSSHGEALFVVTRQQLLDIARECGKAAQSMPKPSRSLSDPASRRPRRRLLLRQRFWEAGRGRRGRVDQLHTRREVRD